MHHSFQTLVNNCKVLADSLEELKIDFKRLSGNGIHFNFVDYADIQPISSLKSFTKLTKLEVVQEVLLQENYDTKPLPDILPASLEHITIICPDKRILRWLNSLLDHRASFPNLCGITLSARKYTEYDERDEQSGQLVQSVWRVSPKPKFFEETDHATQSSKTSDVQAYL